MRLRLMLMLIMMMMMMMMMPWTRLLASGPLMGTLLGRVAAGLGRNTQPKQGANWCACRGSGTVVL